MPGCEGRGSEDRGRTRKHHRLAAGEPAAVVDPAAVPNPPLTDPDEATDAAVDAGAAIDLPPEDEGDLAAEFNRDEVLVLEEELPDVRAEDGELALLELVVDF